MRWVGAMLGVLFWGGLQVSGYTNPDLAWAGWTLGAIIAVFFFGYLPLRRRLHLQRRDGTLMLGWGMDWQPPKPLSLPDLTPNATVPESSALEEAKRSSFVRIAPGGSVTDMTVTGNVDEGGRDSFVDNEGQIVGVDIANNLSVDPQSVSEVQQPPPERAQLREATLGLLVEVRAYIDTKPSTSRQAREDFNADIGVSRDRDAMMAVWKERQRRDDERQEQEAKELGRFKGRLRSVLRGYVALGLLAGSTAKRMDFQSTSLHWMTSDIVPELEALVMQL